MKTILAAYLLLIVMGAAAGWMSSPGLPRYVESWCGIFAILSAMSGLVVVPVWCGFAWLLCRLKWLSRYWTLICLMPALWMSGDVGFRLFLDGPPSPQRFFERRFGASLPKDAEILHVNASPLADASLVHYHFKCSPEAAAKLAAELNLRPRTADAPKTISSNTTPLQTLQSLTQQTAQENEWQEFWGVWKKDPRHSIRMEVHPITHEVRFQAMVLDW